MTINPGETLNHQTDERIKTLTASADNLMDGRYSRVSGVSFIESSDNATLKYTLDEKMPLDIELNFSSGGYWTVYGESRWITITSPPDNKTVVETTYTHPQTYEYRASSNEVNVTDSPQTDIELTYAEFVMDMLATDLAQKALRNRRTAKTAEFPEWLDTRRDLEIAEMAYLLSSQIET